MLDPYLVLGVGRYDDDQKVKKAYRALSKQYHPDNNINNPNKAAAEETFKKIQIAYEQIMHERSIGIGGPNDPERSQYETERQNRSSYQDQNQNTYQSGYQSKNRYQSGYQSQNQNSYQNGYQSQNSSQNNSYYNNRTAEKERTNSDSWWNSSAFNERNQNDNYYSGNANDQGNYNYQSNNGYQNNNSYQGNNGYTQGNGGFNRNTTGGYYTGTGSQRNYEYSNNGGYYYSNNFNGSTRTEFNNTQDIGALNEVAASINNRDFFKALDLLSTINNRTDVWYYYSAVANLGLGNNVTAMFHAKTALKMKPDSVEYNELVRGMESGTLQYQGRADMFKPHNPKPGNICVKLIIANIALNVFCGGGGAICNGLCAIC